MLNLYIYKHLHIEDNINIWLNLTMYFYFITAVYGIIIYWQYIHSETCSFFFKDMNKYEDCDYLFLSG